MTKLMVKRLEEYKEAIKDLEAVKGSNTHYLCHIINNYSLETQKDFKKRLCNIRLTNSELWRKVTEFRGVRNSPQELVEREASFWDHKDYDSRLAFLKSIVKSIETN